MLAYHTETAGWIPWPMGNHYRFVSMRMIQWEPCFRQDGKLWELWPGYDNEGKGEAEMSSNISSEQKSRGTVIRTYLGEGEVEDTENTLVASLGQHSPQSVPCLFVQPSISPDWGWSQVSLDSLTHHAVSLPSKPLHALSLWPETMIETMMITDTRCSLYACLSVFFSRKKKTLVSWNSAILLSSLIGSWYHYGVLNWDCK